MCFVTVRKIALGVLLYRGGLRMNLGAPPIFFKRTATVAVPGVYPYCIRGDLTIRDVTRPIECAAFLTSATDALGRATLMPRGPAAAAGFASANRKHAAVVFQCPLDSEDWNVPPVHMWGLSTSPLIIVEVAVPVAQLLQENV